MHISGSAVPIRLDLNIVQDSQELLVSDASIEVVAINNWWGSDDETLIERGMQGQIGPGSPFSTLTHELPSILPWGKTIPIHLTRARLLNTKLALMIRSSVATPAPY